MDPLLAIGLVVVIGGLFLAAVAGLAVLGVMLRRHRERRLDPAFVGAPVAHGTVTEQTFRGRISNEAYEHLIVYEVRLPDGRAFRGWEIKHLARWQRSRFAPGTEHPVAWRPGTGDEVRAIVR